MDLSFSTLAVMPYPGYRPPRRRHLFWRRQVFVITNRKQCCYVIDIYPDPMSRFGGPSLPAKTGKDMLYNVHARSADQKNPVKRRGTPSGRQSRDIEKQKQNEGANEQSNAGLSSAWLEILPAPTHSQNTRVLAMLNFRSSVHGLWPKLRICSV